MDDEALQRLLEQEWETGERNGPGAGRAAVTGIEGSAMAGTENTSGDDLALYRLLFTELARPPATAIPPALAGNVVRVLRAKAEKAATRKYYGALAGLLLGAVAFAWLALQFIHPSLGAHITAILISHKWECCFTLACLLLIRGWEPLARRSHEKT